MPQQPAGILKPSSSPGPQILPSRNPNRVSFPPSPALVTATHAVPSRVDYDRTPLVVVPNDLALPERGCPGRTYTLPTPASYDGIMPAYSPSAGKTVHPAALNRAMPDHLLNHLQAPALIPDTSSSSDESDGLVSPPPEPAVATNPYAHTRSKPVPIPNQPPIPYARAQMQHGHSMIPAALHIPPHLHNDGEAALAFLPHSPPTPSPRRRSSPPRKISVVVPTPSSFSEGVLGGF